MFCYSNHVHCFLISLLNSTTSVGYDLPKIELYDSTVKCKYFANAYRLFILYLMRASRKRISDTVTVHQGVRQLGSTILVTLDLTSCSINTQRWRVPATWVEAIKMPSQVLANDCWHNTDVRSGDLWGRCAVIWACWWRWELFKLIRYHTS